MALPIVPVTIPAVLAGQSNGRLPSSILHDTPGQAGGAIVRLVEPAARAWRALTAAALEAGHTLKPTSLFDSYRPIEIQTSIFIRRYTTERLPDRPSKVCGNTRYWLLPDNAPAACPGTSNHGWGLAVDVGEERDGDTGTESIDVLTLQWLTNNELRYGFSHELQVEPWHIRYWAGDEIPDAVLAYEEDDMTTLDDKVMCADGVERAYKDLIKDTWDHLFVARWAERYPLSVQARLAVLSETPSAAHTHEVGPPLPE